MDVQTGVVTLSSDQSLNFAAMTLKIEAGASVILQADQHIAGLQLVGNGSLNVNNCAVFINYGSSADPIATIAGYLQSGYNGGLWNGTGIFSTAAATNSGSYGLGYADSADAGTPAGLPTQTIKIMYTLLGDADLNGIVNGVDFGIVSANFNKGVPGWDQGDFNYDGIVNGIDFAVLAANFNQRQPSAPAVAVTPTSSGGDTPVPTNSNTGSSQITGTTKKSHTPALKKKPRTGTATDSPIFTIATKFTLPQGFGNSGVRGRGASRAASPPA